MRLRTVKPWILGCGLLLLLATGACRSTAGEQPGAAALSTEGTCRTNEQCGQGEFCSKLFNSCGESGKCEPRPADCIEHGHVIDKPVCGCDGKTYGNFCLAAVAGTNVKSEGKCPSGS
jgi:hypothetical protein